MAHRNDLRVIDTSTMRDDECAIHAPSPAECATEIGADDASPFLPTPWFTGAVVAIAVVALAALIALLLVSPSDTALVTSAWI